MDLILDGGGDVAAMASQADGGGWYGLHIPEFLMAVFFHYLAELYSSWIFTSGPASGELEQNRALPSIRRIGRVAVFKAGSANTPASFQANLISNL